MKKSRYNRLKDMNKEKLKEYKKQSKTKKK